MKKFTHNLAIAIGINQYQNGIAKLNTAKPDAETLAELLKDKYQYQVELITDGDNTERKPTLKELENLLTKWLPEQLQPPAENNRLLFYFAGHGMPLESDDGPRGFLLPQDANPNPKPGESHNFLSMQVLHDALIALPCHHLIVILDCCFAGTFRWASTRKLIPIPETIHREHYDRFIRYPAWQVITSAAHNQEALDFLSDKRGISEKSQGKQHSPFAEALFEALQDGEPDEKGRRYKKADLTKDGVITTPELYLYLRDNVETRSGDRQTPGLYPLKKHDRGEYIFHDPNFDRESLSEADPIDETNNPYQGLKPFEEEHARFFFGRQELIENLYTRIAAPDHSLTVVLGVSGSGKSSLVKAGLIPYLRELSKPEMFAVNLVKICILTSAILDVFPKLLFLPQLLPINFIHQWHILNPIRPGESPFAALARTIWAIADLPTTVQLDSLSFLSERLNQEIKQLQPKIAEASSKYGETSRTTQGLKLEAEKFTKITTTWNQDSHTAKQLLIVEHFETLYALCATETEPESQQQHQLKHVFLTCLNPLTQQLQSASNSFIEIVKAWSQKHPGVKLLLVIDQFEELITLGRKAQPNQPNDAAEEWQEFLQLLETTLAANLPQLRIIITLRSDFEPRFLNSEALKSYWTKARFPVRAMRSDELRQAIAGPASEMALYFEPANLVDRLIDEVGQMPGALPLLSFTLSEFYIKLANKWKDGESSDRALTIDADFDKEGGVAGSLTRKANEEYQKIGDELGAAAQITMRRVMLRMLTLEGGETARRRVPESELEYPTKDESDRVQQVVERLLEARLFVKGQLETGEPYVEAAHDFLVRGWGTLQDWINEENAKETLELQQRLTAQANDWDRNNRPDGLLMPDGDRLNQLEKILKLSDNWLNLREKELIQNSIFYRDAQQEDTRKSRLKIKLQEQATEVDNLITTQPLNALTLAVASIGQNLDGLQEQIITPVQTSLRKAMDFARISLRITPSPDRSIPPISRFLSVALSPDGGMIASGDNTIYFWNLQGNALEKTFEGHEDLISCIAFSPNNQMLVSSSRDSTIRLWNLRGNPIGQIFRGHQREVTSVAFSPDGQMIVSGGNDSTIRLWDLQGSLIGRPFEGHQKEVTSVVFSPDGQMIVSGGEDSTIRLWDLRGSLIGRPFEGHQGGVISVAFSPDGKLIASGGRDTTVRLWDLQGHLIGQLFRGGYGSVNSVAFSPDSQIIVSGSNNDYTIRLWGLEGNLIGKPLTEEVNIEEVNHVTSVAFSPDGQTLVNSSSNRDIFTPSDVSIRLWDLQSISMGYPFEGHEDRICSVAFSPNSQIIISGSWDCTIRLWNLQGKPMGSPFRGHKGRVHSVAFSHSDGQMIVSGSADSTIRLWDLQGNPIGEPLQGHEKSVTYVAFSPDNQMIVSGSADSTIRLWDLQGNPIGEPLRGHGGDVTYVAFSPDNQMIMSRSSLGLGSVICFWDLQGNLIKKFHTLSGYSVGFDPHQQMMINGNSDCTISIWSLQNDSIVKTFRGHDHDPPDAFSGTFGQRVESISFSPDGQTIVSGGGDSTVRLWDLQGNPIGEPLRGHKGDVLSVVFSPNGEMIVSAGSDKTIRLWRGSWRSWLKVCCDRLRYHPIFINPESIENEEQREIAIAACETCQKYVWNKEDTSV
ncbi:eIF2A-related protein [Nostoc sp. CCY 9925]|uniref:nSTAND1 domain-containing NTPase n=1 Tax=Nostoc sp. CCY 9925 TaxID=3103865 RepID=UPI0039C6B6FA